MAKDKTEPHKYLPRTLPFPETTMYGAVLESAKMFPDDMAYSFQGKKTSYSEMMSYIDRVASAFCVFGIKTGDCVTLCLPNIPQAIVSLYALNRIGAVANMIHPLSSQKEITFYLNDSKSKAIVVPDLFYETVAKARDEAEDPYTKIIVVRIQDELPPHLRFVYWAAKGRSYTRFPNRRDSILWTDFLAGECRCAALPDIGYDPKRPAVSLYSGGTSGRPKGILLSDFNFNALGMQIREVVGIDFRPGLKFLSVMPVFHGFGLGIGIHTILENGAGCILVPQFTNESYARLIVKEKPNFIAGVPTIFASLLDTPILKGVDLSFLVGVYCGGDTLPVKLKHRFDEFLREHNAGIQIREGYGLTECVTASCLTPIDSYKDGGIGIPFRDMLYAIVRPGTFDVLPAGEQGEIIISGPTVMLGYRNCPEENESTLRVDPNGRTWLFTGDLGYIDDDGYVYFVQRLKRMIVTSGYNVSPVQVEEILSKFPDIEDSCVIGVPDEKRIQKIRAYIVLKEGIDANEKEKEKILAHCKLYMAYYAKPREIVFRKSLPKTLVGKVAYHQLEEEAKEETERNKSARREA